MSEQPLEYRIAVEAWSFLVREIRGTEALNTPFRFEAKFVLDHQSMTGDPLTFDPDLVIKQVAHIVMTRGIGEVRRIQGVVTSCSLSAAIGGAPEIEMVIEPRLALLGWRKDIRVHRNLTVPQIVTEVVEALGVSVDNRLAETYDVRPYCVQYRETDLDYVHRLLEDEGIYYYFTHGDVMVLGDKPGAYEPIVGNPVLPFHAAAGENMNVDAVHEIGSRAELTAGEVTLRDWNTEHPSLDMDVTEDTSLPQMPEWYDYPGEYEEPEGGKRKARLHAEAFDRKSAALVGASTCGRIYPGSTFTLLDAPVEETPGGPQVVRKVVHDFHLTDASGFTVDFEADPADVTYRPPRETFVPRSFNPVTGIVCTDGQDIQCDHFGRVKVHFHWDRLQPYDDDCSHWIPCLQDNTGGSSAIPRKDWEVLVHFLEGDPDRPIVLGRVYNGADPMHEPLPETKTRSSLRSLSTPTRDGSNEIMFEDKAGGQVISVHAQKDQLITIARNRTEQTNATQTSNIGNDESITVGSNAQWDVGKAHSATVDGNQTWSVGGNSERTVESSDGSHVEGDKTTTIGGNHERKVYADDVVTAKILEEKIGGDVIEQFEGKHNRQYGKQYDVEVGGSVLETAKETKTETTNKERKEKIAGMQLVMAKGEVQLRVTENRTTTVGGPVFAKSVKELTLTGAHQFISHSPTMTLNGAADITLKVGDTVVLMKDGIIRIDAPQQIAMLTDATNNQGAAKSKQI